jgi:hypothetical protein
MYKLVPYYDGECFQPIPLIKGIDCFDTLEKAQDMLSQIDHGRFTYRIEPVDPDDCVE